MGINKVKKGLDMKNTAKSLLAVIMTFVMLFSSVVVLGISSGAQGSATKTSITAANNNGIRLDNYGFSQTISGEKINIEVGTFNNSSDYPTGNSYINGFISSVDAGTAHNFALAFTLTPTTKAIAGHYLRFKDNSSVRVIEFMNDGSVKVLGKVLPGVTLEKDVSVDFHLEVSLQWASAANAQDGWITVAAYVNGVYVKTCYQVINTVESSTALRFGCSAKQAIDETNGVSKPANYFTKGYGTTSPEGYWATMKYTDLHCYTGNVLSSATKTRLVIDQGAKPLDGQYDALDNPQYAAVGCSGREIGFKLGTTADLNLVANLQGFFTSAANATSKFGFSFTMTHKTEALAEHSLRLIANDLKVIDFKKDGSVQILGQTLSGVTLVKDVSVDFDLYFDIQWPSAANANDGTIAIETYVDGVYINTYSHKLKTVEASAVLQFQMGDAAHITESNGIYLNKNELARGYSGKESPAGYYALCYYENMASFSTASKPTRNVFIYSGASMRLKDNAASSGLRFTFGVDKAWFDHFGAGAKVGALIIPTDKLTNGFSEAKLETLTKGTDYIELFTEGFSETAEEANASTYVYYASLVNILDQNYTRSFTGVGFVELANGTRIYTGTQSRSIYEVAKKATAAGRYEGSENESRIDAYLDKVVSLDADFTVEAIENYDCGIVGAASGAGFTLTGESVDKIKTIIFGGVSYTGGWTVEGDVLTVLNCTSN